MAKNERKLTPAEQKRKEQFALVCEEMERQGYRKIDLTIGVVKANLLALIVMLPFAAPCTDLLSRGCCVTVPSNGLT